MLKKEKNNNKIIKNNEFKLTEVKKFNLLITLFSENKYLLNGNEVKKTNNSN